MSTYREIVYMCLDELKLSSDDSYFTEDHILFLMKAFRALLLKQLYEAQKQEVNKANYQTICINLEDAEQLDTDCSNYVLLRSIEEIPNIMKSSNTSVFPDNDYYNNMYLTFVSKERMRFVGHNKWLSNFIYCSLGADNKMYVKSSNPQSKYISKLRIDAIFEDPEKAEILSCDSNDEDAKCDILDREFPLEEGLITTLIQQIVAVLSNPSYKPVDSENNAADNLADLALYIARNTKSEIAKKLTDDDSTSSRS